MSTPSAPANDIEATVVQIKHENNPFTAEAPPRKRSTCKTAVLGACLVLAVIGFGGGGFFVGNSLATKDCDDGGDGDVVHVNFHREEQRVRDVCTEADFFGDGGESGAEVSPDCVALLNREMSLYEALVYLDGDIAAAMEEEHERRRHHRHENHRRLGVNCDGEWSGTCCSKNRPGPATGPSPICRVIMNSNSKEGYYECSWWNPFCWAFCEDYDEVKYCYYFGNE